MSAISATRVAPAGPSTGSWPALRATDLHVWYSGALPALRGVSVEVPRRGVVAVLGANGAGKTTLLRAMSATLRFVGGRVVDGSVELDGVT
jgi:ABC-type branched-subunit amino acid transport system ATPase component